MVGDKVGNHGLSLAEVESPYCIFGGTVCLLQSRVLAHVFGPGFDQESLEASGGICHVAEDAPVAAAAAGAATRRGSGISTKGRRGWTSSSPLTLPQIVLFDLLQHAIMVGLWSQ